MRIFTLALLGAVSLSFSPQAALDLTVIPEQFEGEGIIYQRLVCKWDARRVELALPTGWTHRNLDKRHLVLLPEASGFAEVSFSTTPLLPPLPAEEAVRRAQDEAVKSLPPDSAGVTVVSAAPGASGPGARESIDVTLSFKRLGFNFTRNVSFVNYPDERLVLQYTARDKEVEATRFGFARGVHTLE